MSEPETELLGRMTRGKGHAMQETGRVDVKCQFVSCQLSSLEKRHGRRGTRADRLSQPDLLRSMT